jgi:hypothetical protein
MSALSIQPTYPIFTDIDGQPLEAGYVWIGTANLDPQTNPINVYWDAALTILAPQPIRTLAGYPSNNGTPARLYVNSDYSIRVMNKNGSVVYSAPEATERYNGGVISSINATQVVYDPAPVGSVPTDVQSKLRERVSIMDFGAVGDGVTDDWAAFQAALDASPPEGYNIYVPKGVYVISQKLIYPSSDRIYPVMIQGDLGNVTRSASTTGTNGSVSVLKFTGTGVFIELRENANSNIRFSGGFQDIKLVGPGVGSTGVNAEDIVASRWSNVSITGFENGLIAPGFAYYGKFDRLIVGGPGRDVVGSVGIQLGLTNGTSLIDIQCQSFETGVLIGSGRGFSIIGGTIEACATGLHLNQTRSFTFSGLYFENHTSESILITGSTNTGYATTGVLHGCTARIDNSATCAIRVSVSRGVQLSLINNIFGNSSDSGVAIVQREGGSATLPPIVTEIGTGWYNIDGGLLPITSSELDLKVSSSIERYRKFGGLSSDTTSVTGSTVDERALLASSSSTASGALSAAIASDASTTSGPSSSTLSARDATASSSRSTAIAVDVATVSGTNSAVIGGNDNSVTASQALVLGGRATINNILRSVALGDGSGSASTANRTIHLFNATGDVSIAGTLTQNAVFTDFAEIMPNGTGAEIPAGTILTMRDGAVYPAQDGDEICGVVSHTAAILAGDTPFCWQGRYLHDEWGRRLFHDVPDSSWEPEEGQTEADRPLVSELVENPDWNPDLPQVPRSERPQEWTPVGMIGQVFIRTGEAVASGDRIKAVDGLGFKSTERTGLKVLNVTKAFDGGCGIAKCLVNIMV